MDYKIPTDLQIKPSPHVKEYETLVKKYRLGSKIFCSECATNSELCPTYDVDMDAFKRYWATINTSLIGYLSDDTIHVITGYLPSTIFICQFCQMKQYVSNFLHTEGYRVDKKLRVSHSYNEVVGYITEEAGKKFIAVGTIYRIRSTITSLKYDMHYLQTILTNDDISKMLTQMFISTPFIGQVLVPKQNTELRKVTEQTIKDNIKKRQENKKKSKRTLRERDFDRGFDRDIYQDADHIWSRNNDRFDSFMHNYDKSYGGSLEDVYGIPEEPITTGYRSGSKSGSDCYSMERGRG